MVFPVFCNKSGAITPIREDGLMCGLAMPLSPLLCHDQQCLPLPPQAVCAVTILDPFYIGVLSAQFYLHSFICTFYHVLSDSMLIVRHDEFCEKNASIECIYRIYRASKRHKCATVEFSAVYFHALFKTIKDAHMRGVL